MTRPSKQPNRQLVENRLAACVNVVKGVESIYEWKGKIEQDNELLLIVKSHSSKTKQLTEFVEKNHPYDCPEVLTVEVSVLYCTFRRDDVTQTTFTDTVSITQVESGSKPYLDWIHQSISKKTVEGENVSSDAQNSKE